MADRIYGPEEKIKLEKLIAEGCTVLQEIEDLRAGLRDTVKSVANELEIKSSVINKAINIALKGNWENYNSDWEEVEAILDITKRL